MLDVYVRHWRFHIMFFMRSVTWENVLSGFIRKNKIVAIIRNGKLHTPENNKKYEFYEKQCPELSASKPAIVPKPQ